ncbi:MAG: hypothetical protein AABP62_16715 [Planctomycetota bacterium]
MADSPEWIIAKAAGDSAEISVAEWFRTRDFETFKTLGLASFDLLLQATVEVKRDLKAAKTGNVSVEVSCNGQSSGIYVSKATYWVFVLDADEALLIRTPRLLDIALRSEFKEVPAGDGLRTRVRLIPTKILRKHPDVRPIDLSPPPKQPRSSHNRDDTP